MLKVRFANVDRSASPATGRQLARTVRSTSRPRWAPGSAAVSRRAGQIRGGPARQSIFFCFRPDINLAARASRRSRASACWKCWRSRICSRSAASRPVSWRAASSPSPWCSRAGTAAISLMWREYGVRLTFLPTVTARGTIRLKVAPEVSSLDYTNAISVQGITVPASRRAACRPKWNSKAGRASSSPGCWTTRRPITFPRCRASATYRFWASCSRAN